MSAVVKKQFRMADARARQLEQLAEATGSSESALVEVALDLLFRERSGGRRISPEDATFVVGTPVAPRRLVRNEEC